jgi:hypothetical protein
MGEYLSGQRVARVTALFGGSEWLTLATHQIRSNFKPLSKLNGIFGQL